MLRSFRAVGALVSVLVLAACAEPPLKEMNQAQGAIDAARAAGAEQYAGAELAAAAAALEKSEEAVAQKDHRLALSFAIDSRERAQVAARTAVENRARARGDAERIVAEANSALARARDRFGDAALAKVPRRAATEARDALTAAEERMQEARTALDAHDYPRAVATAESVTTKIQEISAALEKAAAPPPARKRR